MCDPIKMTQPVSSWPVVRPWRDLYRFEVGTITSDLDRGSSFACAGTKPAQVLLTHAATGSISATCVPRSAS